MAGRKVMAYGRQTVWDLAIQEYGGVDGLFLLLQDNELPGVNTPLVAGQLLHIKSAPVDADVTTYYRTQDLHPVSGPTLLLDGDFNDDFNDDFFNTDDE